MRLATLDHAGPDGVLVVISQDGERYAPVPGHPTLLGALEQWASAGSAIARVVERLAEGGGQSLAGQKLAAPLPRTWQWLDASAYPSHRLLMERLFGVAAPAEGRPLMYQGLSHRFLSATEDAAFPSEDGGIDFEGEFGVITDFVPMGTRAEAASKHIRLIVQINDWSLRAIAPIEMKTGFGWIQAKPACSLAPYAISPDELGDDWRDGRVRLPLRVWWNGALFGAPEGGHMEYGFHELIAHAAATRDLCAGTLIGSGTVSNSNFREVGSSCIAERRGIELLDSEAITTPFMAFGDTLRMAAGREGQESPFGAIDQRVVRADI